MALSGGVPDRGRGPPPSEDLREAPEEPDTGPPEANGVIEALRQLSPNQRAAIVLFYEVDLPVADVARRLGITSATARVHLHRGRTRLREILGAEEVE